MSFQQLLLKQKTLILNRLVSVSAITRQSSLTTRTSYNNNNNSSNNNHLQTKSLQSIRYKSSLPSSDPILQELKFGKRNPKNVSTYLVFPEIPNDTIETNEFLHIPSTGEIPFDALTVEKCVRASGLLSIEFEHFIDEYSQTLNEELEDKAVSNAKLNEFILETEKHLLPLLYNLNLLIAFRLIRRNEFNFTTFDSFFEQRLTKSKLRYLNRKIYCLMCEMKSRRELFSKKSEQKSPPNLSPQQQFEEQIKDQLIGRYIREAKLFGLSLKDQNQLNIYNLINQKLATQQHHFIRHANEATRQFQSNIMSPQFLDCLPDHVITQIDHHNAVSVFNSFMRYCPDQNLRKDFWLSYNSRAAPYFGSKLNNYMAIEKIRSFRQQQAQIFGFENFASFAIDLRGPGGQTMAGSTENVRAFINGLGARTTKTFDKNLKELTTFATLPQKRTEMSPVTKSRQPVTGIDKLNLWDLKYFERLFLRESYQISTYEMRSYFPLDTVMSGMLEFAENLFGIKIVEIKNDKSETWGVNVHQFKVFDNNQRSSAEIGSFYFDPFQREERIVLPIPHSRLLNTKPVVMFMMNFLPERGSIFDQYDTKLLYTGKELLNFSQVVKLFGNFGFVLQHLLTEVGCSEIGGLSNLESDTLQTIFHFMRMWPLNSYQTLARCSKHCQTGEQISEEYFERIRKAHYHFSSLALKQELYLMALDQNLHSSRDHSSVIQKQTWAEWMAPFELIKEDGHICSFMEIFAGNGLEGVYYGDKWSEVIAADIFDAFREVDLNNQDALRPVGHRLRDTFLAQNGAIETNELFRRFRGRDPTLNGYLSIHGFE